MYSCMDLARFSQRLPPKGYPVFGTPLNRRPRLAPFSRDFEFGILRTGKGYLDAF